MKNHKHTASAYITINTKLCKACWNCISACPEGILGKVDFIFHKHIHLDDPESCIGCLACEKICPEGAIVASKH